MTKTVDDVIADIDGILDRAQGPCTTALAAITRLEPRPQQAYGCLELFHMQSYELIYNAFFVRDGKLEPEYACSPGFTGEASFIPELASYIASIVGQLNWSQEQGEHFTSRHEKQFADWFKRCWLAAGGEQSRVPTYFCFEKEYRVQDIVSAEVLEEDEAARRLGYTVASD